MEKETHKIRKWLGLTSSPETKADKKEIHYAHVESRMRICIPIDAAKHISLKKGDYVALISKQSHGRNFLSLHKVRVEDLNNHGA